MIGNKDTQYLAENRREECRNCAICYGCPSFPTRSRQDTQGNQTTFMRPFPYWIVPTRIHLTRFLVRRFLGGTRSKLAGNSGLEAVILDLDDLKAKFGQKQTFSNF